MTRFLCVSILWAGCAAAQTIEGTVVNSATGAGIAAAKVEILGNPAYSATTDQQGRFRIEEVKEGVYRARFSSPGYWYEPEVREGVMARRSDPGVSPPFQVSPGGNSTKVEGRMIPLGRMAGSVIDGRGKAVPNARLDLSGPGRTRILWATDASGKFDVHQLLFPGNYTLSVAPPLSLKPPDPEPDSGRLLGWARTYYPGVAVRDGSSKIVMRPGGDLLDIEIKLLAVPAFPVRGVVLKPDGTPASKATITLGEDIITPVLQVESKPDGAFEFPAVVNGEWRLSTEVQGDEGKLRASQWIVINEHELQEVRLQLSAPFTVRVGVVTDAPKGLTAPQPPTIHLTPISRNSGPLADPMLFAHSEPEGGFTVDSVYPGRYRIDAEASSTYYLSAVRMGDTDLRTPEIELSSGAVPITLVYKTDGGKVRGTVEKCASGGVVLTPQDPNMQWPMFVYRGRCDSSDRYEIAGVRPGDYYAVAFPVEGPALFWEPQFDDDLVNQASRITVRAGETSSADLHTVTPVPY